MWLVRLNLIGLWHYGQFPPFFNGDIKKKYTHIPTSVYVYTQGKCLTLNLIIFTRDNRK